MFRSASGVQQKKLNLMQSHLSIRRESELTWSWSKSACTRNKHVE